tara:strand:- start:630 stop:1136 length:507 start_codon:yes stop_codon:yes gene_type:complete
MALWGTKDTVYSTGNINVNVTTGVVTKQSGSIAWTSGNGLKVGQVLTVEGSEGVIESIDSATQLTIGTEYLPAANISNKTYEIREKPKSTLHDSNWGAGEIYGVDTTEITVANAASGNARKYAPPHAGWVGITTYNDNAGNLRVKHEVLVAGSTISADSGDDTLLPDS